MYSSEGLASLWMASGQNQAAVLAEQVLDVLRRQQAHLLHVNTTLAEAWLDCPMISVWQMSVYGLSPTVVYVLCVYTGGCG